MDLQDVGGGCGDWMELAQDRDSWQCCNNLCKVGSVQYKGQCCIATRSLVRSKVIALLDTSPA